MNTHIKTNSAAEVISGIFCKFRNMQGFKTVNSCKFLEIFKTPSKKLVSSSFLVGLQPVD